MSADLSLTLYSLISICLPYFPPAQPSEAELIHNYPPMVRNHNGFGLIKGFFNDIHLDLTPLNMPVDMKNGHMTVECMPSNPSAASSKRNDSSKPTAANLEAQ